MKTLIAAALIASAALSAVPASAQVASGAAAAIAHFNRDLVPAERVVASASSGAVASTRSTASGRVQARFNADYDGQDDVRGQRRATVTSGRHAPAAAAIFASIAAAQAEDE